MTTRDIMNIIMRRDDLRYLKQVINVLDKRERIVIEERFGFKGEAKTLDKLASQLHCSRERIRQLQLSALKKLKREFRKIDPDFIAQQAKAQEVKEEARKQESKDWSAIMRKKMELEVRQEIREKLRQRAPQKPPVVTESAHHQFISLFDFSEYDVKRFRRLVKARVSIEERIRTVVAELHPELIIKEILQWELIGKYLVTSYQPCEGLIYKRMDIYLPYFLASKEDREKFINEVQSIGDAPYGSTVEDLLQFLKQRE